MGDEKTGPGALPEGQREPASQPGEPRGAGEDLAQGLEFMLRAARKAAGRLEPGRLEALGRRAMQRLDDLDARAVGELGRKAVKSLDPKRIEEIASEAGRELLSVVERVAGRVESAVTGAPPPPASAASPQAQPGAARAAAEAPAGEEAGRSGVAGDQPAPARVRVDDES
ncbi:MAG: hypothetical protein OZ921_13720 [Sorangiineae bacterium]|nr:hypothetical protein [Polyangiaceae bacterium]MEB2323565.1 hypothetical protein [Sorangiineae bacterium]